MRYWKTLIVAPAIMIAAACNRGDNRAAADSALNRDLSLANQVTPYQPVDSAELGLTAGASRTATPRTRTTSTRRRSTSSVSSGGTVTTSSGGTVVQKNTKRDAIIGAAAGAAIGAATSRDKLKGAVVGGVVGGVLGGVIGNNVDVKKKRPPQ